MVWVTSQVTVVRCRQLEIDLPGLPGMYSGQCCWAAKMGKGGFKLFLPYGHGAKPDDIERWGDTLQMVSERNQ